MKKVFKKAKNVLSKLSFTDWALAILISIDIAAVTVLVVKGKDNLGKIVKRYEIVKEGVKNKAIDIINSTIMSNSKNDELNASVAIFISARGMESYNALVSMSVNEAMSNTQTITPFVGSGGFVRTKLFSQESDVVLSAYHVCVSGVASINLKKAENLLNNNVHDLEPSPVGLLVKSYNGDVFVAKDVMLYKEQDLCLIKVDKKSKWSLPMKRQYHLFDQDKLHFNSFLYGYSAFHTEAISMPMPYHVTMSMPILCDVKSAFMFLDRVGKCFDQKPNCDYYDLGFSSPALLDESLNKAYLCANGGLLQEALVMRYVVVNAVVYPGFSGSPVLDKNGLVVGVVSARSGMHTNVGLIVRTEKLAQENN